MPEFGKSILKTSNEFSLQFKEKKSVTKTRYMIQICSQCPQSYGDETVILILLTLNFLAHHTTLKNEIRDLKNRIYL